jgi:hypothetical protein
MGDMSGNCALTGLEIASGDEAYGFVLTQTPEIHMGHTIVTAPVRGVFHSGWLTLTENVPLHGLTVGDDWTPYEKHEHAAFIHADVFDSLASLQVEGMDGDTTIATDIDKEITGLREKSGLTLPRDSFAHLYWIRAPETYTRAKMKAMSQKILPGRASEASPLDQVFDLYRRCRLVKSAELELRHPISAVRRGPETGGARALRQMNEVVNRVLDAKPQLDLEDDDPSPA